MKWLNLHCILWFEDWRWCIIPDSRMEFDDPACMTSAETLPKEDLGIKRNPKLLGPSVIKAESRFATDDNSSRISEELRVKRRMDRHNRHIRSIKRFQPPGIIEERSSSMSSVNKNNLASNRLVDTSKKSSSTLPRDSASARSCKPIVYRPIVRKAIELKRYDHIVTNVIDRDEK